ncbi:Hypothetical_protein [Hexamita inflata]|uniref:Hypothetical_protein n=1 Tax=Hexamita inflata TaxID=28002 RepID=A0AA86Q4Z2_9EUKA|nr:Hypothetical protein HINF_LOCUS37388 [Hexamita inflata]
MQHMMKVLKDTQNFKRNDLVYAESVESEVIKVSSLDKSVTEQVENIYLLEIDQDISASVQKQLKNVEDRIQASQENLEKRTEQFESQVASLQSQLQTMTQTMQTMLPLILEKLQK